MLTVVINEVLFDPANDLTGDANGDGVRDAAGDEFVEIVNTGSESVDISGWTLGDDDGAPFTFPGGTVLAENEAAVLFGGGAPTGSFGGAQVFTDDDDIGNGLANGGDLVELRDDGGALVDSVGYGTAGSVTGGSDQSVTRDPDLTGSFVDHSGAIGSGGALFSPGAQIDGSPFTESGPDTTPPSVTSIVDDQSGGPVAINTLITFTVTFSEDIDDATVSAADFDNAGSAPITLGAITETIPGVFTVEVTPTDVGDLTLRMPGSAVINDTAGNPLAVPVSDDTTIIVSEPIEPPTDLFLNEIVVSPDGVDSPNEYIEIRGDAGQDLTGLFVVFLESDSGTSLGEVNNGATSFVDLTGNTIGSSGFLVILDDAADPYTVAAGTTIVDVPGLDFENASYTAFLMFIDPTTGTAPVVGQDLDTGDDGLDALPSGWAIVDGVSVLNGGADDRGYADMVFSDDADGLAEAGATFIDSGFGGTNTINHVMRIGDSTGSTAADWVAFDHDAASSAPDFTIGQSTDPAYALEAVITDHLGASNPTTAGSTSTAVIIDNGEAGYSTTSGWVLIPDTNFPTPEGRDGDMENSGMGSGADVATWTFEGLTAGTYRVSATWTSHENRATNAPYSIFDGTGGALLGRTLVNQEDVPDDFMDDGSAWEDLGFFTITGAELVVELSDAADEYVIADAVRIDAFPTAPPPGAMFIDDGDAGYADSGWSQSPKLEGRLNDIRYQSKGAGAATATWTFTGLTPGNYTVAATWAAHPNRAGNAPYTISGGGDTLEFMRVDQKAAPDDFFDNGGMWETIAVVAITGDTLVVEVSNDAGGFVIADAIRIAPTSETPLPAGTIIDDGDAGFTTTVGWNLTPITEGRDGDVLFAAPGNGSRIATWTFGGLTAGTYRVSATWSTHANRATNAPYTIFDGAAPLGTVEVNQQIAPGDFSSLGSDWEDLMEVTITGDTLVVQLSNNADGFVIADAVRIQPVT